MNIIVKVIDDKVVVCTPQEVPLFSLVDQQEVTALIEELKDKAYDAFGPDYSSPNYDE